MGGRLGEGEDLAYLPPLYVSSESSEHAGTADSVRVRADVPVWLAVHAVDPDAGRPPGFAPDRPSLRVRADGIRLEASVPASLRAWIRLDDGQWRAVVVARLASPNGSLRVDVPFWCRPEAIKPR